MVIVKSKVRRDDVEDRFITVQETELFCQVMSLDALIEEKDRFFFPFCWQKLDMFSTEQMPCTHAMCSLARLARNAVDLV